MNIVGQYKYIRQEYREIESKSEKSPMKGDWTYYTILLLLLWLLLNWYYNDVLMFNLP